MIPARVFPLISSLGFTSAAYLRESAFVVPTNGRWSDNPVNTVYSPSVLYSEDSDQSNEPPQPPHKLTVAFTRESGKNAEIREALAAYPMCLLDTVIDQLDLPCIEHALGEEHGTLLQYASEGKINEFDYVVITSPEAARVFGEALRDTGGDATGTVMAAVGKATEKALKKFGLDVGFLPSEANGATLVEELPVIGRGICRVLYPVSAKAAETINEGLGSREVDGVACFEVTRLHSYDTVPVAFDDGQMKLMAATDVVCFGSPSAVDGWLRNVDKSQGHSDLPELMKKVPGNNGKVLAACIGTTTARAVLESGRWEPMDIYYPKNNPGMESWAESTGQALGDVHERSFWGGNW
mmetsp:Transcript_26013/g.51848  ORF Transcript_26013/g.51848 Transcript_26013/m.51848 type:complete len:353 (-) Transcript_26013:45-1103(-)